ncbi:leucine-rich repeat domain-containing protein [Prevotella sp. KH2C16]|uniref:leucine-rich repeat domain-containing protein n=1 Tax=Prevotella sp. KH2C16 TaxID=1855325 RepID=UPI0008E753CA|nr:leucine-rich repeat domain-containing protein [Prevotella sp. KH2C16]SFG63208.1 Leucine rich repeat-containing protein [Prevotella sp. KH2C16]
MKQTKLLLLLLLALVMSATGAFAQTVGTRFDVGTVTYEITVKDLQHPENNKVGVFHVGGSGTVTIPNKVRNETDHEYYYVTTVIPWESNQISDGVTEMVLPEGLVDIPAGSFRQCGKIQSITIPSTCTSIGTQSFMSSGSLTEFKVNDGGNSFKAENGVLLSKDGSTLVCYPSGKGGDYTIPSTVTTVNSYAFSQATKIGTLTIPASVENMTFNDDGSSIMTTADHIKVDAGNTKFCDIDGVLCSKDKKTLLSYPARRSDGLNDADYTIPEGVTTIAPRAFYVGSIKSVDFNDVQTIGNSAFEFSYGLRSVHIGDKVNKIEEAAFTGCGRLASITVDDANNYFKAEDNVLFTKDGTHLMLCVATKTGDYVVPESVTEIDGHAFYETTAIGKVTISKNVKNIGSDAFGYSGVTGIDFAAGSQLETIGRQAFAHTTHLTDLTLPASVKNIEGNGFSYSEKLQSVTIEDNSQLVKMGDNCFSNNPELTTFQFAGSTKLTTVPTGIFANDPKLTSFEVPATVTEIKANAFQNTPQLESVTFATPASITTIGENSFAQSGIKSIEIPNTVTAIKKQAFDNCKGLETVEIPASVATIETGTFNMCDNLTAIHVNDGNPKYSSLDGMLCDKNRKKLVTFPAGKADTKYTLVPYFEEVASYAFYGSDKVSNITFPKSVTTIGQRAIALCDNLKSLSFMGEDKVPVLTADIMYESGNTKDVTVYVRKKWYENTANDAAITNYNNVFKEVHPSFVSSKGYDRGTEFFPTSTTHVGAISFYNERTSVILDKTATEDATTTPDRFGKTFPEKTYEVSSVLDFAYENTSTVKAIVSLADMSYIGMNAFKGSSIEDLYFVGDIPGELGSVEYEQPGSYSFKNGQNIYVKRSRVSDYNSKWEIDDHTLNITAEIPQATNRYGATRCYPFDTQYNNGGDVRPYLPVDFSRMSPAYPYAKARRIDDGYVPANLGVLLHSVNAATADSYCEMTDEQDHHAVNDPSGMYSEAGYKMVGVLEDTQVMSDAGNHLYAFSKGQGKFLKIKENPGNKMPYFSAYLKLDGNNQAKAFSFRFDDESSSVTGIEGIATEEQGDDAPYYNLNGIRVEHPQKGVYIHNGKKVIIK